MKFWKILFLIILFLFEFNTIILYYTISIKYFLNCKKDIFSIINDKNSFFIVKKIECTIIRTSFTENKYIYRLIG